MEKKLNKVFLILIIVLSIITVYLLFSAKAPNSLLRYIIKNPVYDPYIALFFAILVSVLSFYFSYANETSAYKEVVKENLKLIKKLKKNGKNDRDIAEEILDAMKIKKGIKYRFALKRLAFFISQIERIEVEKSASSR